MSEKNHVVEFIEDPVKRQMRFVDRVHEELHRADQRLQRRMASRWEGWIRNNKRPNQTKPIVFPTVETLEFYEYMSLIQLQYPKKSFKSQ